MAHEPNGRGTPAPVRVSRRARWASLAVTVAAAIGVLQFYHPPRSFLGRPLASVVAPLPNVEVSADAFGKSGEVKVRLALPGDEVEYPLEVQGDPTSLSYQWVRLLDTASVDSVRPLMGAYFIAPPEPGMYRLALVRQSERLIVDDLTLAVLVPFDQKEGPTLNGYRIGTYLAEKLGARSDKERPEGFVEVVEENLDLRVSTHLRLADLIPHDGQTSWPRYVALSPLLLDKLELVLADLSDRLGNGVDVQINVHAGFRSPAYNSTVQLAATDSRHQYGDALDVAIDADGDGRFTANDLKLVTLAVERVERDHPDLVGGLGLYTSNRYKRPFAHIDVRGRRARWVS